MGGNLTTVKVIITGADLNELKGCDDLVQDLINREGIEWAVLTFKGKSVKDVSDVFMASVGRWPGVSVNRKKETDGSTTLQLSWTEQARRIGKRLKIGDPDEEGNVNTSTGPMKALLK
jgi:hypothetical protein